MKKSEKCPICNGPIPNALHEGKYAGALSRVDNKTEICSECGVFEALQDFVQGFATATDARRTTILEEASCISML
jgi:hypothetical protein